MKMLALTLYNGAGTGSQAFLRSQVIHLQKRLGLDPRGIFGKRTERTVIDFQKQRRLKPDGIVGPKTWTALDLKPTWSIPGFSGDPLFIHLAEGHRDDGRPYFPGGNSGVTLNPGFDLGQNSKARLAALPYGFTDHQLNTLGVLVGLKGFAASNGLHRLMQTKLLDGITVSRETAERVLYVLLGEYWQAVTARFPQVTDAPGSVQTALLSLAYNRGPSNPHLEPLREPLQRRAFHVLAKTIRAMEHIPELPGLTARRQAEADLIDYEIRRKSQ